MSCGRLGDSLEPIKRDSWARVMQQ